MEPDKIAAEINRLSVAQKLILAQDIWDSIAQDGGKLRMPEWQKNELEKRYAQYQHGKMELLDWREIHNELRERHYGTPF
ncbi:MAG: addiction module protein [Desulfobulbaceae bacterium]|nr:addiction module protein [Desulfobulbaceae bacterium]